MESEGEGWEWWGLMERGWRRLMERGWRRLMERGWSRLMEGCWTLSLFIVASSWRVNVIAHRCHLVVASPGRVVLVPCRCPCAVSLWLAHCGTVLCLNEVGWGEGGMGARWDGGTYLASTTMNDGCCSSFWLPHRCRRHDTCIPC